MERALPYLFILTVALESIAFVLCAGTAELWRALPVAVFAVVAWGMWSLYKRQHRTDAYSDYLAGFQAQELKRELDGGGIDDGTVSVIKNHLNGR